MNENVLSERLKVAVLSNNSIILELDLNDFESEETEKDTKRKLSANLEEIELIMELFDSS